MADKYYKRETFKGTTAFMGSDSLFSSRRDLPPQPDQRAHDPASRDAHDLALNAGARHVAWISDEITTSTGGESMRISTVRQLSRTLGTILASLTDTSEKSKELLHAVQLVNPTVDNYSALLNMTVKAIVSAGSFAESTPAVLRAWREAAGDQSTDLRLLIIGLVAVTRDSCTEMLQELLSKPAHALQNQSMDGSIKTSFNLNGDLKQISIRVLHGQFSRAFVNCLRQVEDAHADRQRDASARGEKPAAGDQKLSHIVLTIDHSFRKRDEEHYFHVTKADFMQAYLTATFEYAAVAYADRVRTRHA